jgi:hypothetical protein
MWKRVGMIRPGKPDQQVSFRCNVTGCREGLKVTDGTEPDPEVHDKP